MSEAINLSKDDSVQLINLIVKRAVNTPGLLPQQYLQDLVDRTNWPDNRKLEFSGTWKGNPSYDTRKLITYALSQPVNPIDSRFTTIGSLLNEFINDVDLTGQRWVASLILSRNLYRDSKLLHDLMAKYNIPELSSGGDATIEEVGPDFEWWGTESEIEIQSWIKPEPEYEDVGVLMRIIERAASVCRIEIPQLNRVGTGVLIAPNLVLTNYHVLKYSAADELAENGKQMELFFGKVTLGDGHEAKGAKFKLVGDEPVLAYSSTDELDFALLQVEEKIKYEETIQASPYSLTTPAKKDELNILQHPGGKEMKLARNRNGVTAVREDLGLIQYYTLAAGGSSGSPCYNGNWEIVSLHHAERSLGSGVRREGILFTAIHKKIAEYL